MIEKISGRVSTEPKVLVTQVMPSKAFIVTMDWAFAYQARQIGRKAFNMARIGGCGMVPRWICVTTTVFEAVLSRLPSRDLQYLSGPLSEDRHTVEQVSARLQAGIRNTGFLKEEMIEILAAYDHAFPSGECVAVRSSSTAEDAADHSFAGQFESFLNVQRSSLLDRILDCFASAFSMHCLLYRDAKVTGSALSTAVIIQEMVFASSSGVLFTRSPSPARSPEMIITASYGLGEGVVQDLVESDSFVLKWDDGQVLQREVKDKTKSVVARTGSSQGTELEAIPSSRRQLPSLNDTQLQGLHAVGRRLELAMGSPQDVEWAFDEGGTLHLLQSRPITTLSASGTLKFFDCSNISENYHGATTALTFSYLRRYYEQVFRSAAITFGMNARDLHLYRQVFANLVSYLHGGAYYNLANLYRMFYAVPGFKHFVASFEHGVGLNANPPELNDLKNDCARAGARKTTLATYARIAWTYLTLDRKFRAHKARFANYQQKLKSITLTELDADELMGLFEEIQQSLGTNWGTPLVNDYFAFNWFMLLENVVKHWGIESSGVLLGDLMRGAVEPISVEPITALRAVAVLAAEIPALSTAIQQKPQKISEARALPEAAAFNIALSSYLDRFADRRPDELKFEAPTLSERPEIVWNILRNFLQGGNYQSDEPVMQENRIDSDASRSRALVALKGHPIRRALLKLLLSATHKSLVHREYGRLVRSQRCGVERAILMEVGARLTVQGAIRAKEDIVHLSLEEIEAFVQGSGVTSSLEQLIDLRRQEYEANEQRPHPLRVITNSLPQLDRGTEITARRPSASNGSSLNGTGCSPGFATGRARVVKDPFSACLEPGDVLVTSSTDPAWAFLMATAAGLVVERGNLLSHAAIIGRELGIPCVIGVEHATHFIRDGQIISIDGTAGSVVIVGFQDRQRSTRKSSAEVVAHD